MSLRRSAPRFLLLTSVVLFALVAAACGGDDDDPQLEDAGPEISTSTEDGGDAGADTTTDDPAADDGVDAAEGADAEEAADDADATDGDPEVGGGADIPFPTPATPTGEPAFTTASKLTTVGLDDVFFGDTVRTIRTKVDGEWVGLPAADARPSCFTMQPAGGPEGTVFMILDGGVERIDIASPEITTRSGIGVGSTEAEIIELFEANIDTLATDTGNEIVFTPTDEADREFRIIWSTDGSTVTAMRAGRVPGVLAASPCA